MRFEAKDIGSILIIYKNIYVYTLVSLVLDIY